MSCRNQKYWDDPANRQKRSEMVRALHVSRSPEAEKERVRKIVEGNKRTKALGFPHCVASFAGKTHSVETKEKLRNRAKLYLQTVSAETLKTNQEKAVAGLHRAIPDMSARQIEVYRQKRLRETGCADKPVVVTKNPVACLICQKVCEKGGGLSTHVRNAHKLTPQQYYDTYKRQPSEGICKVCNEPTKFQNATVGYYEHCSLACCYASEKRSAALSIAKKGKPGKNKGMHHSTKTRQHLSELRTKMILEGSLNKPAKLYFSAKNNKEISYRSSYELAAYHILEQLSTVKSYVCESFSIPYIFKGAIRRYIPDILVEWDNGTFDVIEVKPHVMRDLEMNQAKFEAAYKWCKAKGFRFCIWDEVNEPRLLQAGVTA